MLDKTVKIDKERFYEIFLEINHDQLSDCTENNEVKLFMLGIENNEYSYSDLNALLKSHLGRYALSRKEFEKDIEMAISNAIAKLRDVQVETADKGAGGELGEILIYLFLEIVLGAPKLLSKVEIKTTKNQYVYNADGVHFYSYDQDGMRHNQVIFCEAKLIGDVKKAIKVAVGSLKNTFNNIDFERNLISAEILKETVSENTANEIIDAITPKLSTDCVNKIVKENAIGLFIGFDEKVIVGNGIFDTRDKTIENLKKLFYTIVESINNEMKNNNLVGRAIYVYLLPFNQVMEDRKDIMAKLLK